MAKLVKKAQQELEQEKEKQKIDQIKRLLNEKERMLRGIEDINKEIEKLEDYQGPLFREGERYPF